MVMQRVDMEPPNFEEHLLVKPSLPLKKSTGNKWFFLLSVLLNIASLIFFVTTYVASKQEVSSSVHLDSADWWSRAAAQADQASKVHCSGHGRVHVDTIQQDVCECTSCFTGKDCSQHLVNCIANVNGGDPLFLEPFWETNAGAGAVVVSPTYRMSYSAASAYTPGSTGSTQQLEKLIRQLHEFVGNAITEDRFILLGTGSTELVNAALASLVPKGETLTSGPSIVVSRVPYYSRYKTQSEFFKSTQYFWAGDPVNASSTFNEESSSYIELVAAPNNPDASMLGPVLKASSVIYDRAYYWPHFTSITKAVDDDVTLFTLSKLTGHAGTRLGWAIIKDETVYRKMVEYVSESTLAVSHDAQLRATALLRAILDGYGTGGRSAQRIFHFGHSVMSSRWERLSKALERLPGFSLQPMQPKPCLFFNKVVSPSPAYAWVKCEDEGIRDCYQFFIEAGIQGRAGREFGAGDKYIRFALLIHNDGFEQLMNRLALLLKSK